MDTTRAYRRPRNGDCVHKAPPTPCHQAKEVCYPFQVAWYHSPLCSLDPLPKECQATEKGGHVSGPTGTKASSRLPWHQAPHLAWGKPENTSTHQHHHPRLSSPKGGSFIYNHYNCPLNKESLSAAICHTQCHQDPVPNTCRKKKWVSKVISISARRFLWEYKSLSPSRNHKVLYTECQVVYKALYRRSFSLSVLTTVPLWGRGGGHLWQLKAVKLRVSNMPRTIVTQPAQGRARV